MSTLVCVKVECDLLVQCMCSIGRALLLVSENASPDPPCQWWKEHSTMACIEGSISAGDGETVRNEGGSAAVQMNQHSTLSLVMRKEEASTAEVCESV